MKATIVPAQITTVEDRIMGSLGLSQLLLLTLPLFLAAASYCLLPPVTAGSSYKYISIGVVTLVCCLLAVRLKGKILAAWVVLVVQYHLRPKRYLYDKNSPAYRPSYDARYAGADDPATVPPRPVARVPRLAPREAARVLQAIDNQALQLRFETTKKGGLNVRLTEIDT